MPRLRRRRVYPEKMQQLLRYGTVEQCCSYCGGTGTRTATVYTNEKIPCRDCGGDGSIACSICKGRGYVTCSTCRGNVYHACALCKRSGVSSIFGSVDTCPRCDGRGSERCSMCDGSGHRQCSRTEICKTCWGGGVSDTRPVVKNENRDCEYCGYNHKEDVRCGECYGNGYVNYECSRCNGSGQITVR